MQPLGIRWRAGFPLLGLGLGTILALTFVIVVLRVPASRLAGPAVAPAPALASGLAADWAPARGPILTIVIDDVGRDARILERFLDLELDLTFAVLPHAKETARCVELLRRKGREILVHLPMIPIDRSTLSDEPVVVGLEGAPEAATLECLSRIPGAVGVNNHMGSALCTDARALSRILPVIASRGLWLLDSRTIASSRICEAAAGAGIPCRERDVFLDDPPSPTSVERRLEDGISLALKRGLAIAIGHPHRTTLQALRGLVGRTDVKVRRLSSQFLGDQFLGEKRKKTLTGEFAGN